MVQERQTNKTNTAKDRDSDDSDSNDDVVLISVDGIGDVNFAGVSLIIPNDKSKDGKDEGRTEDTSKRWMIPSQKIHQRT